MYWLTQPIVVNPPFMHSIVAIACRCGVVIGLLVTTVRRREYHPRRVGVKDRSASVSGNAPSTHTKSTHTYTRKHLPHGPCHAHEDSNVSVVACLSYVHFALPDPSSSHGAPTQRRGGTLARRHQPPPPLPSSSPADAAGRSPTGIGGRGLPRFPAR